MTNKQDQQIAEMGEKFSGDSLFFKNAVLFILEKLATEIKFSLRFGKTMIKLYTQESKMLFIEIYLERVGVIILLFAFAPTIH